MKGSAILIFSLCLVLFSCKSEVPTSDETKAVFQKIQWVLGEWTFTNEPKGQVTVETWEKTGEFELTGSGVTKEGDNVIFNEKLSFKIKDDAVYFVADVPQNKKPVWFKVIESDEGHFLVENSKNDFPKQIRYTMVDNGNRVRIELLGGKRVIMNYFKTK